MPSWLQGVNAELNGDVILTAYRAPPRMMRRQSQSKWMFSDFDHFKTAGAAPGAIFVWNPTFEI
jgi:hypothetical protein